MKSYNLNKLKICIGYKLNGKRINYLPMSTEAQCNIQPIYITLPGWNSSTVGIKKWNLLPANAKHYLRKIEQLICCKISIISNSPERKDTILIKKIF